MCSRSRQRAAEVTRRLPSTPPNLPGFTYVRVLGSGGFADVFLYEQNMPRRQVAVKVLLAEVVTEELRRAFRAEADHMAQLSSHPSILTVYHASVSADGRPFLVMEYCSSALTQRARSGTLPLDEALSVGVRVGSAVETAHRIGVLHRDIKPSNILTTAYGHPVLSDFGIASTIVSSEPDDSVGLSIPWSAPEVLRDETGGTIASEVWALGATVYSLVAGRSPFESADGDNSTAAMIARIARARVPRIERGEVPERLQEVLLRAMARRPEHRYLSALELVRDLQAVELEIGFAQTVVEIAAEEWAQIDGGDPNDRTSVRPRWAATAEPMSRSPRRRRMNALGRAQVPAPDAQQPTEGRSASRSVTRTVARAANRSGRRMALVLVGAALLVVGVVAGAFVLVGGTKQIPVVSDVEVSSDSGIATFTWNDPGLRPDDAYLVSIDGQPEPLQRSESYAVLIGDDGRACVTVAVSRDGQIGDASAERCVEADALASRAQPEPEPL